MAAGLRLMKSVLTPSAKNILLSLGLSAGMSAADASIQKKIYESGTAALIISNEEMVDIMKMANSLEETGLLIKGISETIKNKTKKYKGGFLSMLLGTLAVSWLGSTAGKGVIRAGEGAIRAAKKILMSPHPLTINTRILSKWA